MPRGRWVSRSLLALGLTLLLALTAGTVASAAETPPTLNTFQLPGSSVLLDSTNAFTRPWLPAGDLPVLFWPLQPAAHLGLTEQSDLDYKSSLSSKYLLAPNTELRVSFLYKQDPPGTKTERGMQTHLLFKYAMDYRVLPNLQVGLTGYFYQQHLPDYLDWKTQQFRDSLMGLGPGLQYDLGRWSFMVRSQLETGTRERRDGINSWFRVWYSF